MAQLGIALCPCDGTLSESAYRPVVERLVAGIEQDPALLLEPLAERVASLAAEQRFEEAAWARDRHHALARALDRRRAWQALQSAGRVWAESEDGSAVIDAGRLVTAWPGEDRPLIPSPAAEAPSPVPRGSVDAEEAHLLWRWLTSGRVRILESQGPLSLPIRPVRALEHVSL
jgi:DNA polymerase-3 subunit epsilon